MQEPNPNINKSSEFINKDKKRSGDRRFNLFIIIFFKIIEAILGRSALVLLNLC